MTKAHPFPIIDAHVHVHPDMAPALAEAMEANHVSRVVNAGTIEGLGLPFEPSMRAFRDVLGNRIAYFSTPDWSNPSPGFGQRMAEDLERKIEGGARGLKIFKELGLRHRDAEGQLIPVDDRRLDPLWARAGELGAPVLIHTADPVSFFEPLDEKNENRAELQKYPEWYFGGPEFPKRDELLQQFSRMIGRHPGTTFIGAHVGHYSENLDYVDACLERYPNYYVDTTARIAQLGRQPVDKVRAFFVKHQDRVIFGTDLTLGWEVFELMEPAPDQIKRFYDVHWRFFETEDRQFDHPIALEGDWKVNAIGLPEDVLHKLYYGNVLRLIPEW